MNTELVFSDRLLGLVDRIWSDGYSKSLAFDLWDAHLSWLNQCGFSRAFELWATPPDQDVPSGHEVVGLLAEYVATRGFVNAHLGLTSSDIVDNVRLIQVRRSLDPIRELMGALLAWAGQRFMSNWDCLGFTHWQPAAPLAWEHRARAWFDPITNLMSTAPAVFAKKFGGPVGDGRSLRLVIGDKKWSDEPFDWEPFELHHPRSGAPLQSSDHTCELEAVQWCARVAAQLCKIAGDLRFLYSHGHVTIRQPDGLAGSSSMAHKINPHHWEKVSAICRAIATKPHEMWDVMAHNGLERTLDTSWQIKRLLPATFKSLAQALVELTKHDVVIDHASVEHDLRQHINHIFTDHDLTRRVLAGEGRWPTYLQMLKEQRRP